MSKSLLRTMYRYVVTYQDEENPDKVLTFSVNAATAAIATAITIGYIEEHHLHTGDGGYSLIPRVSKSDVNHIIN